VASGTVDVIGNGFFEFLPGNGLYVDLDGSTKNAGILTSRAIAVTSGSYLLWFDLAGSRRGSTETTTVRVGSSANPTLFGSLVVTLPSSQAFTTYSIALDELPTSSDFRIQFENTGGDNIGMLLDRVVLDHIVPQGSAVPEPSSILLGISAAGISVAAARLSRAR
jgi:hypothetical protein